MDTEDSNDSDSDAGLMTGDDVEYAPESDYLNDDAGSIVIPLPRITRSTCNLQVPITSLSEAPTKPYTET